MYVVKASKTTRVRKIHMFNVDEIDTGSKPKVVSRYFAVGLFQTLALNFKKQNLEF